MQTRSSWSGFLPPHALVMGRVGPVARACTQTLSIVVGEGNPEAELVFVATAPSPQDDQLLDKMIQAMGLSRDQVYRLNIVKSREPRASEDRLPELDEVAPCKPDLEKQLSLLQPKVVVALGQVAAQLLLQTQEPISNLRGSFKPIFAGRTQLMATFHPADLLLNPQSKREAWSDLQAVAQLLGVSLPSRLPPKKG